MANIMQVIPSLTSGGVERGVIEVAKFLPSYNHGSLILSSGGKLITELDRSNVNHVNLNVNSKNPYTIWSNISKIKQIIKDFNIDILHVRSRAPAWSCYYASNDSKAKLITTVHGIYGLNWFKRLYNNVMTKGEIVIAVSSWVKNYLLTNYGISESKIRVIPRGVDAKYFNPANVTKERLTSLRAKYRVPLAVPILLLPGRVVSWKGHKLLIDALQKLSNFDFYCLIVGDLQKHPKYVSSLRNHINDLRMQAKIQIFDTEQDMLNLYAMSDIVLSTSTRPEAFGRTIIEAQSMKKLVIASNIGGASETICDGLTGLHFEAGRVDDLVDKLKYALKIIGTTNYDDIVKNANQMVKENYTLQSMLSRTLEVYNQVL